MPKRQGTTKKSNGALRVKKKNNKKVEKSYIRGLFRLKRFLLDAIYALAIDLYTEITGCQLCSQFLVMTAIHSCCEPCLFQWMNQVDHDDEIKCRLCNRPIKTVLSGRELKKFCDLVNFDEDKIMENGHSSYPILHDDAMDLIFNNLEYIQDTEDDGITIGFVQN